MALVLWPDWPLDFCFRLPVVDSSGGAVELEGMPDAFTLLGTIARGGFGRVEKVKHKKTGQIRSEEHTSELQSQSNLVCRLLLEKKKTENKRQHATHYS